MVLYTFVYNSLFDLKRTNNLPKLRDDVKHSGNQAHTIQKNLLISTNEQMFHLETSWTAFFKCHELDTERKSMRKVKLFNTKRKYAEGAIANLSTTHSILNAQ